MVAIGGDVEASIMATYALVDLGIERIWAKAVSEDHGAILTRVGAHRIVFPEHDMGVRVAHSMTGRTIDYLELDPGFALVETTAPRALRRPDARGGRGAHAPRGERGLRQVPRRLVRLRHGRDRAPSPATSWSSPASSRRPRPSRRFP